MINREYNHMDHLFRLVPYIKILDNVPLLLIFVREKILIHRDPIQQFLSDLKQFHCLNHPKSCLKESIEHELLKFNSRPACIVLTLTKFNEVFFIALISVMTSATSYNNIITTPSLQFTIMHKNDKNQHKTY